MAGGRSRRHKPTIKVTKADNETKVAGSLAIAEHSSAISMEELQSLLSLRKRIFSRAVFMSAVHNIPLEECEDEFAMIAKVTEHLSHICGEQEDKLTRSSLRVVAATVESEAQTDVCCLSIGAVVQTDESPSHTQAHTEVQTDNWFAAESHTQSDIRLSIEAGMQTDLSLSVDAETQTKEVFSERILKEAGTQTKERCSEHTSNVNRSEQELCTLKAELGILSYEYEKKYGMSTVQCLSEQHRLSRAIAKISSLHDECLLKIKEMQALLNRNSFDRTSVISRCTRDKPRTYDITPADVCSNSAQTHRVTMGGSSDFSPQSPGFSQGQRLAEKEKSVGRTSSKGYCAGINEQKLLVKVCCFGNGAVDMMRIVKCLVTRDDSIDVNALAHVETYKVIGNHKEYFNIKINCGDRKTFLSVLKQGAIFLDGAWRRIFEC